jgi:hypothetical protein
MNVPNYDAQNPNHQRLIEISRIAHEEREGTRNKELLSKSLERELDKLVRKVAESD